jgi:hypothetical protein
VFRWHLYNLCVLLDSCESCLLTPSEWQLEGTGMPTTSRRQALIELYLFQVAISSKPSRGRVQQIASNYLELAHALLLMRSPSLPTVPRHACLAGQARIVMHKPLTASQYQPSDPCTLSTIAICIFTPGFVTSLYRIRVSTGFGSEFQLLLLDFDLLLATIIQSLSL